VGAAINLRAITSYLPPQGSEAAAEQHKSLILDSPGLHWEEWFWLKFPDPFIHALSNGLKEMGIEFSYKVGNLAQYSKHYCDQFPDWNIAYLQSTMDLTMSVGFSTIGPFAHRDLVLGPTGLLQTTSDPTDRCTAWI